MPKVRALRDQFIEFDGRLVQLAALVPERHEAAGGPIEHNGGGGGETDRRFQLPYGDPGPGYQAGPEVGPSGQPVIDVIGEPIESGPVGSVGAIYTSGQAPQPRSTGMSRPGSGYSSGRYVTPLSAGYSPRGEPYTQALFAGASNGNVSCLNGYDRSITPESLMADKCIDPVAYVCDKSRGLPPWLADAKPHQIQRKLDDFSQVGTVGQLRTALQTLYALGGFANLSQNGVLAANTFTSTFPNATTQMSIGFIVDWGIQLQNFTPFDMRIRTTNFVAASRGVSGADAIPANRDFTTRVGQVSGGRIYVPFAVRVSPGMSVAQQSLAIANTALDGLIEIVDVPVAIQAAFSVNVTLLTAFHPVTAAFSDAFGAYSGGQ